MIAFADFLRIVRGDENIRPYPWQERLAERCVDGEPPSAIAIPTGAGKTTTIDALVWALAHQADRPAAERTIGVRIVWAIDRRILVDETHAHAERLASLLAAAVGSPSDPLCELATRLADLSGDVPLVATRWRGGLQDAPERCGPLQPQIISSTVAQIGSRLLFRGYGVGERSLAIEAGLAACDTTICLDEAHLAEPFRETIDAIREQRKVSERAVALPGLRAVTLTATPPRELDDVLGLDDADRVALGQRFTGEKHAELVEPETALDEKGHVGLLADAAAGYVRNGKPTVACVVNTVRRARAVFDVLRKELGGEADVALLIGPQRPGDRERMLEQHRGALFDGEPGEKPLVCVATQTFEVGLDADVAAMVTESASATALVQRLGRLNRRGETRGHATIVRDEGHWLYEDDEPAAWEWLRGLVRDDGTVDVSVAALEENAAPRPLYTHHAAMLTPEVTEMFAQTSPRPGSWREPDPDVFLRGVAAKPAADVAVCWRSDLRPDLVGDEVGDDADAYRSMLLELAPPQRQELITLSLTGARGLLAARFADGSPAAAGRAALLEADVEDAMPEPSRLKLRQDEHNLPFLVLRRGVTYRGALKREEAISDMDDGGDETAPIWPDALQPGDVIVLPTDAGGVDEHGLAPLQPRGDATDIAADLRSNGAPVAVRITFEALGQAVGKPLQKGRWQKVVKLCRLTESQLRRASKAQEHQAALGRLIVELHQLVPEHPGIALLVENPSERIDLDIVLRSIVPINLDDSDVEADDESDEEIADADRETAEQAADTAEAEAERDTGEDAHVGGEPLECAWVLLPIPRDRLDRKDRLDADSSPPTIDRHARAVSDEVRTCTQRLKLAAELSESLILAARAHDHGKADPRTQAFYRRGVRVFAAEPIAKSEFGTSDPQMSRTAKQLAGLPTRQRHEIASVKVLSGATESGRVKTDGLDIDLALHVVGVHHGLGRPIPGVPRGGNPARPFEIDAAGIKGTALGDGRDGWADGAWLERFGLVLGRYGAWGAAYLEALLVTSDHLVSSRGE
ncbi:MAG TPA: type I-U CRISPR-associated helicase/endonuclease Cas3 [Solirubrobacteraceae bacterium]